MINRRGALVAIASAVLNAGGCLLSESNRLYGESGAPAALNAFGAELVDQPEDGLTADLARLSARAYSEEGIPMFLACENVAGTTQTSAKLSGASSDVNRKVASAFHRYSEEWQRIRPKAPATDVAKIVELLADRDFAQGATEASL